jgi:hypothetical protein
MKYETNRAELIKASESLTHCLEEGQDEDAQQWCLQIINGLYGMVCEKVAIARRSMDAMQEAMEQL